MTSARNRGVFLIPSFFTTLGLLAGFYSITTAIQGRFEAAAWGIIIAAVFDMLDGRAARLLNAETEFGAQYDSLCDMLSFGVAPAVLLYVWVLTPLTKTGWLIAFLLVAGAALRLARFNVEHAVQDNRYFHGLPTPAAALLIATGVLFHQAGNQAPNDVLWAINTVALSWFMVSNVRFISGKNLDLNVRKPFAAMILMLVAVVILMAAPYRIPFLLLCIYCLHGPALNIWQHHQARRRRRAIQLRRSKKTKEAPPDNDPDTP
ncbi:MAG: CDP-diacylglycerol--serine O-phosphatidyltransferase [Mariprofundales bacterium]|nr:CDP-diacylglycerol--serine O-phosphatidyltransferase [Mariprofundales bacterium]